jgi:hypothetical protein
LTTSFYIRSASHDASASISIRITDGRGAQFRFNTGHRLNKASSWKAKTRSVRSVACESYELLNLQLRRLETTIEAKAIEAKSKGQVRSKGFYGATVSLRPPKQVHTSRIKMKFEDFNNIEIKMNNL